MGLRQDLELDSGRDYVVRATLWDGETGLVMNLSAVLELEWALGTELECRRYHNRSRQPLTDPDSQTPAPKITKTMTGAAITVTDPTGGKIAIAIDAADSEPLCGKYYHELCVTNSAGKKSTAFFGSAEIKRNSVAA